MKQTGKLLAFLLALAMTLSLAACNSSSGSPSNSENSGANNGGSDENTATAVILDNGRLEKFVIGMANDPQELAPWNPNNLGKNLVWHQIYECLFDLNGAEYVPALAKDYVRVDETTYDVEIYDYIQDSAGNPITADDVVYSYQVLVDSGYGLKYDIFDGVEKIDDYTVRFHFTTDPMVALGALEFIWAGTAIFSQAAYEGGNFAVAPVGTGPYMVSSYQSGSKLILEANENYWQTDELTLPTHRRNVQTIEYDIIAEAASQTVALTTGSIQYSDYFDTASLSDFEEGGRYSADFNVNYADSNMMYFILPNDDESSICHDVNLRMAIFYALDNVQLAAAVTGLEPAYTMGTSIFADYDSAWETEENYITVYNTDLAKDYLEQSSYNGEKLRLVTLNGEVEKNISTIVVALLGQVGINVDLQVLDEISFQTASYDNGAWDLLVNHLASGGFCTNLQQWCFDNTINDDDLTIGNTYDEELQRLYELCNTVDGNNKENMNLLRAHWIGQAYIDPLTVSVNSTISSKILVEPCFDNNLNFVPGGSTYTGQ